MIYTNILIWTLHNYRWCWCIRWWHPKNYSFNSGGWRGGGVKNAYELLNLNILNHPLDCHHMGLMWYGLTHWGRDKMATTWQTVFIFLNEYYSIMIIFVPLVLSIIFQHWLRLWLGFEQATFHYSSKWWIRPKTWRELKSHGFPLNIFFQ